MFTTKARLLALIMAAILCLSAFLTGCAGEAEKNAENEDENATVNDKTEANKNEDDENEEEIDVVDLLKDAYKETKRAKFLTLSGMSETVSDGSIIDSASLSGTFGYESGSRDFAGHVIETYDDGKRFEWYYTEESLYGYNNNSGDAWLEGEDGYDLESACMEDRVFSALGITSFNNFAKDLADLDVEVSKRRGVTTVTANGEVAFEEGNDHIKSVLNE